MSTTKVALVLAGLTALIGTTGCDYNNPQDYNPRAQLEAFQQKQAEAKEAAAKGASTATQAPADPLAEIKKTYATYCSSCHGPDGKAATPTAQALNPKPRNFDDKAWQASVDDAHIAKVIKEGGPSVGLSATMAPWGGALNDEQIQDLVKLVRVFGEQS